MGGVHGTFFQWVSSWVESLFTVTTISDGAHAPPTVLACMHRPHSFLNWSFKLHIAVDWTDGAEFSVLEIF